MQTTQTRLAVRALQVLSSMTPEELASYPTVDGAAIAAQRLAHDELFEACAHCGGTGRIEEAATLTGRNVHSACSGPCPVCDGNGEVQS